MIMGRESFELQACRICEKSKATLQRWQWNRDKHSVSKYTSHLSYVYNIFLQNNGYISTTTYTTHAFHNNVENSFDIEEEDSALYESQLSTTTETDIHIVYSNTYKTPVLYFNMYRGKLVYSGIRLYLIITDGKMLNIDEIHNEISSQTKSGFDLKYISQTDHPHLQIPFFHLHPCNTPHLLKDLVNDSEGEKMVLVGWISWVAPIFRIPFGIEYALE